VNGLPLNQDRMKLMNLMSTIVLSFGASITTKKDSLLKRNKCPKINAEEQKR